ncbi:chlorite dismutase family protein [Kiritimatiellota bacterium B12222]|nr:chlorite dismutase family protein [Kiritimatiellota bacterium B12222]
MENPPSEPVPVVPDVLEHGHSSDGQKLTSDRRLYMQLQTFTGCNDSEACIDFIKNQPWDAVVYQDAADPWGLGLLLMHTDPEFFVSQVFPALKNSPFSALTRHNNGNLFARSYSIGYESDLEHTLVNRPRSRALNPEYPWVVWYPLRRTGAFAKLTKREKMKILGEHGTIGRAWGDKNLAHDIRLASFGMDRDDNDFVVALVGDQLLPLSKIVEVMRGTVQTSTYIEKLGPFFVGKVVYQSAL